MTSEIQNRAPEIRDRASKCETVLDLAKAMNWPIQSAHAANDQLQLGLPVIRPNKGVRREAQASPKPVAKKGAK